MACYSVTIFYTTQKFLPFIIKNNQLVIHFLHQNYMNRRENMVRSFCFQHKKDRNRYR